MRCPRFGCWERSAVGFVAVAYACIRRHYFMKYFMKLEEAKPPLKKLVVLKCKSRRIKSLFETIEFYVGPLMRMICLVIGK